MLRRDQLRAWVDRLGTPISQVQRDHLISHILMHLPDLVPDATFFGGTALCRTHLLDWRLSEDIDLLVEDPAEAQERLSGLGRSLRREYPGLGLDWATLDGTQVAQADAGAIGIRIQLVQRDASYRRYPAGPTNVSLRYGDLPAHVMMRCPTRDAAAAMKLAAWSERAAPRDLCDLFGLVLRGQLTAGALEIMADAAWPLQPYDFAEVRLPDDRSWQSALSHQMAPVPSRERAFREVRRTLATLAGWSVAGR